MTKDRGVAQTFKLSFLQLLTGVRWPGLAGVRVMTGVCGEGKQSVQLVD